MAALLAALKPGQLRPSLEWLCELAEQKEKNVKHMEANLAAPLRGNFSKHEAS
jgi:hypothetical protein